MLGFGFKSSLRRVGGHIVLGMDPVGVSVEITFCLHSNLLSYADNTLKAFMWIFS